MANLGAIIQDIMVGNAVAQQLIAEDAALRAGQPASVSVPLALYGHQGNLSIVWNPNGSGIPPAQVLQNATAAPPPTSTQIGKSSGVPITIGSSTNGVASGTP